MAASRDAEERHHALFAERLPNGSIRCGLCPHECSLAEGRDGLCKVRGVRDGRLLSHVYGRPATVVSDEIEKKPLYHFHPGTRVLSLGTLGCNVLCGGCQNWQISHAGASPGELKRLGYVAPADALALARKHKLAGVAFTYNDPVVWIEYVRDVCVLFKEAGLYTAFITAGYLSKEALEYVAPSLDAFKFDLKAPGREGWSRLSKVKDPVPCMERAVAAKLVHGCHVEVVSNIVPGLNDSDEDITAMAGWVKGALGPGTPWHVTRFLPDFELTYLSPTPMAVLDKAVKIGRRAGLQFVYVSNIPDHVTRHTVCPGCQRTVIQRDTSRARVLSVRDGRCALCGTDLGVVS